MNFLFDKSAQGLEPTVAIRGPFNVTSQEYNNMPKATVALRSPLGRNRGGKFCMDTNKKEFTPRVNCVAADLMRQGYEYMVINAGWYSANLSAKPGAPVF